MMVKKIKNNNSHLLCEYPNSLLILGKGQKPYLLLKPFYKITNNHFKDLAKIFFGPGFEKFEIFKTPIKYEKEIIGYTKTIRCIPFKEYDTWLDRFITIPYYNQPTEYNFLSFGNYNRDGSITSVTRSPMQYLYAFQFLRSKGYDLPHVLLEGKTFEAAGLAEYKKRKK